MKKKIAAAVVVVAVVGAKMGGKKSQFLIGVIRYCQIGKKKKKVELTRIDIE